MCVCECVCERERLMAIVLDRLPCHCSMTILRAISITHTLPLFLFFLPLFHSLTHTHTLSPCLPSFYYLIGNDITHGASGTKERLLVWDGRNLKDC